MSTPPEFPGCGSGLVERLVRDKFLAISRCSHDRRRKAIFIGETHPSVSNHAISCAAEFRSRNIRFNIRSPNERIWRLAVRPRPLRSHCSPAAAAAARCRSPKSHCISIVPVSPASFGHFMLTKNVCSKSSSASVTRLSASAIAPSL